MENLTYTSMLTGYGDRVSRIALFDIFKTLENKQQKDAHNKPIDFFGLGLLSLLFFFENMLLRVKKRGVHELGLFLMEVTQGRLFTREEDYDILARGIIEIFRPSGGKRNGRSFFNYESNEKDRVEFAILKADDWDNVKNLQYYTLDEQGLELIFATKEYFSEFQISINQMMLRKQLEKGEFVGALRQVDEMRINVNTIKDNIYRIKHDIQRNITSEDTYNRYKELIKDIHRRLSQEHDEFLELSQFIKETKGYFDQPSTKEDKEQTALELLVRIDNELAYVHYLHSTLLHESIELKTTALEAAGESLYYAGITSFNFDQELARKVTNIPIPLEETKTLIKPFLGIKRAEIWSPIALFAPQLRDSSNREKEELTFIVAKDILIHENLQKRKESFARVFSILRKAIIEKTKRLLDQSSKDRDFEDLEISVSELILMDENLRPYLDTREFTEALIIMHQMTPLKIGEILEQQEHIFYEAVQESFSKTMEIQVIEDEDILILGDHYEIRNMKIKVVGGIV